MSDEKLEMMAWAELLTNKMAIRSSIRLNSGSSIFSTELIFGDRDTGIFRLKCKRVLGESIERPTTKLEKLNSSLGALLLELRYEWPTDNDKNDRIVDLCLKPVPHVATIIQPGSTDHFLLPPSHPLLLLHYGMVYELIVMRKGNRTEDRDILPYDLTVALWGILKHRFGAFLFQQQATAAEDTLGHAVNR